MGQHCRTRRSAAGRYAAALGVALGVVGTSVVVAPVTAAGEPAPAGLVPGTPCTATARACVDPAGQQAWLIRDGAVTRGPAPISSGGPGQETPTGTYRVEWKHIDHVSGEYGTPMPYSVFFAPGGIAFHEGPLDHPSAGCIRLAEADAVAFFDTLLVGDEVQVR